MCARTEAYDFIAQRLAGGGTLVLDGGVGSELVRRGVRWRDHGLRTDAAAVLALHHEYLEAGAHVIRTNTFQLNRRIYQNVFRDAAHRHHIGAPDLDQRIPTLIPRAVELARKAREESGRRNVAIAGVMSPLEHCFRPDLAPLDEQARAEHAEIAHLLANAGVDLLLLESMNTLGEACVAIAEARSTGLPVWVSFVVNAGGNVLSGESLAEASRIACEGGAAAVLANCALAEDIDAALSAIDRADLVRGACAHIGRFDPPSWKFEFFPRFTDTDAWHPQRYAEAARRWQAAGARIVGGCCGTGPAHIRALVNQLVELAG
jgi:S-methylmethionine-dependent homocysteine/selenocysteine methylase